MKAVKIMDDIVKDYILSLLELQRAKLNCVNLGVNQSKTTKVELDLIEKSIKKVKEKL